MFEKMANAKKGQSSSEPHGVARLLNDLAILASTGPLLHKWCDDEPQMG